MRAVRWLVLALVWPRHDPAVDRILVFTNTGVVVGPAPLKARLDLWQRVWDRKD